jgi:hypothetical protein
MEQKREVISLFTGKLGTADLPIALDISSGILT